MISTLIWIFFWFIVLAVVADFASNIGDGAPRQKRAPSPMFPATRRPMTRGEILIGVIFPLVMLGVAIAIVGVAKRI